MLLLFLPSLLTFWGNPNPASALLISLTVVADWWWTSMMISLKLFKQFATQQRSSLIVSECCAAQSITLLDGTTRKSDSSCGNRAWDPESLGNEDTAKFECPVREIHLSAIYLTSRNIHVHATLVVSFRYTAMRARIVAAETLDMVYSSIFCRPSMGIQYEAWWCSLMVFNKFCSLWGRVFPHSFSCGHVRCLNSWLIIIHKYANVVKMSVYWRYMRM
jgi:hypothetical protein